VGSKNSAKLKQIFKITKDQNKEKFLINKTFVRSIKQSKTPAKKGKKTNPNNINNKTWQQLKNKTTNTLNTKKGSECN